MARRRQLSEHLGNVPMFATCSRGDLKILARHMVEVEVPEGATVCKQGDRADAFYVIIEGQANVQSGRRSVATLGPGGWFGELGLLDGSPRNATVTASTPLIVGALGARVFKAVLRDVPSITEKLLAGMATRLREADRVLADVGAPKKSRARSK